MTKQPKIYIAGNRGMVGSAIIRALKEQGQTKIITRSHAELDLTNQTAVRAFFASEKPEQVYLAAAKVGGIHANNTYPAEFIYQNLYHNLCVKMHYLQVPLSQPMNLMQLQR